MLQNREAEIEMVDLKTLSDLKEIANEDSNEQEANNGTASKGNSVGSDMRKVEAGKSKKSTHACAYSIKSLVEQGDPAPVPADDILYDLADLFKVFGDSTRIKILYALMGQNLCVAHLAEAINMTQSAVSHQLRTLKQARLVKFERDGKNIIYSLADDHVQTMLAQGMEHICE